MIERVQYINQEKSMSEDELVTHLSLIRKNIKDYNELAKYSAEMLYGFMDFYYTLKKKQQAEDGSSKLPVKEKDIAAHKDIEKFGIKNMKKELGNVLDASTGEYAFPLVSSPTHPTRRNQSKEHASSIDNEKSRRATGDLKSMVSPNAEKSGMMSARNEKHKK